MIGEWVLLSVFAPASLITGVGAGLFILVLRRLLSRTGFYRLVWHPGLFDLALFLVFWTGFALLADATHLQPVVLK